MNDATDGPAALTTIDTVPPLDRESMQIELEHRFRHTLRTGQVSPLLNLMLQYKMQVAPC